MIESAPLWEVVTVLGSLRSLRPAIVVAAAATLAMIGSASASRASTSTVTSAVTRCRSVGNGGGSSTSVAFTLGHCRTATEPGIRGQGTLTLYETGVAQITWTPPFEGGTTSHPATWTGTFALRVGPSPDESEAANESCPPGETEDELTGTITRIVTNRTRNVHGNWRMEICGPPTALEPGTAFRARINSAT